MNRTFGDSLKGEKGFSLIELLISLVVLIIVITSIFRVLNVQIFYVVHQRGLSLAQTDAQLGYRFFKWDFLMAGFGTSLDLAPFGTVDSLEGGSTVGLVLTGTALGPDRVKARWSYRLDFSQDSTSTPIVRYWQDSTRDIREGDYVILLSDRKERIGGPYYISTSEVIGGDSLRVYLDQVILSPASIRAPIGSYFIALDSLGGFQNVLYWVDQNGILLRGNTPLLKGVEAFRINFGFDEDGDGLIDTWHSNLGGLTPQFIHSNLKLARVSIVIRSRKKSKAKISPEYLVFPDEPQVGEPLDTLEIPEEMRNYSYFVLSSLVRPRNL